MDEHSEVAIGADVDVGTLMAEIRAEVQRKREAGLYPPAILAELDLVSQLRGGDAELRIALEGLRQSAEFTPDVTTASSKRFVSPVATTFKRGVRASVGWYVGAILQQLEVFAARVVRAIVTVADRADSQLSELRSGRDELLRKVDELTQRIDRLERSTGSDGGEDSGGRSRDDGGSADTTET